MRILLATDGSAPSLEARRMVIGTLDPTAVEVTVLAVAQPGAPMIPELGVPTPPSHRIMAAAREAAERDAHALGEAGFAARAATGYGYAPTEITRFAEENDQRLIVLGGRPRHLKGHLPLGSVSLNVWHHTKASVMIVHRAPKDPPDVLLAVGGSAADRDASQLTAAILKRSCHVDVVSIVPSDALALVAPGSVYPDEADRTDRSIEEQRRHHADEHTRRISNELRQEGFTCANTTYTGDPTVDLSRWIERGDVDLAIVGTRGLGPMARRLLGSVSERVIRSAPATLVVRSEVVAP